MQNCRIRFMRRFRHKKTHRILFAAIAWLSACGSPALSAAEADPISQGRSALRSGHYAEARRFFVSALEKERDPGRSGSGLIEVLRTTGEYENAVIQLGKFLTAAPDSASMYLEGGRIYRDIGEYSKAESFLKKSVSLAAGQTGLRMDALRTLGELLEYIGRKAEARAIWDDLIEQYRSGNARDGRGLGAVAVAAWRKGYFFDARDIFLDATDPELGETPLRTLADFGYLFMDKYNFTEAMVSFRDCLKINASYPDALIGMARAKKYESEFEVEAYSRAALKINPKRVEARNLLAGLALDAENHAAALNEIQAALSVNPADLESLSLLAVCYFIRGDMAHFESTERKIMGIHPSYGMLYHVLAENLVSRRKYEEAVYFSRKAIELDPELWSAYVTLGMNLTRVGDLDGGRRAINQAFEGDGFNVWADNFLNLLDQMNTFAESESEHFRYRMAGEDGSVLSPYVAGLAEEAYSKLTARYGFLPRGPLFVEIFPDHGGFAVRTLGLPGLEGALGVCFGKVIAMDSPLAREAGTFNWGTTLWHEFTHVITLQMTNHNIPRWYSEGLSVFEEHKARPGWGDGIDLSFIRAYKEGKLLKASELNAGFTRPESPERIPLSYLQSALVCEWMEEAYGFESIRKSLLLFAENKPAEEVFLQTLGLDAAGMDAAYARYIEERVGRIAGSIYFDTRDAAVDKPDGDFLQRRLGTNPDDFYANLQMGTLLLKKGDAGKAEGYLKKAEDLFPQYAALGNPYQLLAGIYLEAKREDEALAQLEKWIRIDGGSREPLLRAAPIFEKRRDWASLERVLTLAVYIQPYDQEIQRKLGEASLKTGNWKLAIAAYRTLVALNTADPAGSRLDLATAYLASGDTGAAKKEILRALEIVPSYRKAQELLLKLSGDR